MAQPIRASPDATVLAFEQDIRESRGSLIAAIERSYVRHLLTLTITTRRGFSQTRSCVSISAETRSPGQGQ